MLRNRTGVAPGAPANGAEPSDLRWLAGGRPQHDRGVLRSDDRLRAEHRGRISFLSVAVDPGEGWSVRSCAELMDRLSALDEMSCVDGIVLSGQGLFTTAEAAPAGVRNEPFARLIASVAACETPVVALMPNGAAGAGLELALSCRRRVAAPGARFSLPEIGAGFPPLHGALTRLPSLVGFDFALEMIALGRRMPAALALRIGLVCSLDPASAPDLARQTGPGRHCESRRIIRLPASDCSAVRPNRRQG